MRILPALLVGALGAGLLSLPGSPATAGTGTSPPAVRCSDSPAAPGPAALPGNALPGSADEDRAYGLREEASPEVQDYAGGEVIIFVSFFGAFLVFLFIVIVTPVVVVERY